MAQNYYDATGTLELSKVTPVIKALFSGFKLDESYPENGEAYIALITEDNAPNWDDIREALAELADGLGVPPSSVDDGYSGQLHALCKYFSDEADELVSELTGANDSVWVGDLFEIAQKLDDGHGLKAVKFEGAWHCNKPRLFEFGGDGLYLSKDCHIDSSSTRAITVGKALQAALDGNDLDKAAELVLAQAKLLLGGIRDEGKSREVTQKLMLITLLSGIN